MGVRGRPTKWDKWYSTARWARIRRHQLREHPFCAFCLEHGIATPAEICDHVEAHRGDVNKFWLGPFQSLCKRCHDSTSGSSRHAVSVPILAWMGGHWTPAIRSTVAGGEAFLLLSDRPPASPLSAGMRVTGGRPFLI